MSNSDVITDAEFGDIVIRRSPRSRYIRIAVDQRGQVRINMPMRTPLLFAKNFLHESREHVRKNLTRVSYAPTVLNNGDLVGKSHTLLVSEGAEYTSRLVGIELHITIPKGIDPVGADAQRFIRDACLKALRVQAKAYLTRRLASLAREHGFVYESVRFSNAGTRWGSCSSRGTISLNIWLMQLPFELIDYVLVHELCHTRHMNHSSTFWALVESIITDYAVRRKALKQRKPYI